MPTVILMLLTSCAADDDGRAGGPEDTAGTLDTAATLDTDDTGPGGDTSDTADSGEDGIPVTFTLSGDVEGATLSLECMVIGSSYDLWTHSTYATAPAASEVSFLLEADPSRCYAFQQDYVPGDENLGTGTLLLPLLYTDADEDGYYTEGEPILGAGPEMLYRHSYGGAYGLTESWHLVELDTRLQAVAIEALPGTVAVDTSLAPDADLAVGGEGGADADRVAFVPSSVVEDGNTAVSSLLDVALEDPWAVAFDGEPPADHFSRAYETRVWTVEYPVTYEDADGDGAWSDGDTAVGGLCVDGAPFLALYNHAPADLENAVLEEGAGWWGGWMMVAAEENSPGYRRVLSPDEALAVTTAGCPLPW